MVVLFTFCLFYLWFCVLPQGVHCLGGSKWRWSQWRRTHRKLKKETKRERVCLYVCLRNDPSVRWRFLLPRKVQTFRRQTKCKMQKKRYTCMCIYKVGGPNGGSRDCSSAETDPSSGQVYDWGRGPTPCRGLINQSHGAFRSLDELFRWEGQRQPLTHIFPK